MIDVRSKKCIICLIKQPTFNYKDERNALYFVYFYILYFL